MKPSGVSLALENGLPRMRVTPSDRVADAVWDAVQDAIDADWTVEQFRRECAEAWREKLDDDAKRAMGAWK